MAPADPTLSADVESGMMADRVRMLADRAIVGLAFSTICAAFLVGAYWDAGSAWHLLGWFAIMMALSSARLVQLRTVKSVPARRAPRRWAQEHAGLSVLLGLMWGYAGVVLAVEQPAELRMFGYLVPAGICAGVLATYSAYYPTVVGFTLASMVPITIGQLFQGFAAGPSAAALCLLFTVVLVLNAVRQHGAIGRAIALRFENLDLLSEQAVVNRRMETLNGTLTRALALGEAAEQALEEKTAILETTLEHISQGIVMVNADHRIVAHNARYTELLQLPADLLAGPVPLQAVLDFRVRRGDFDGTGTEQQQLCRLVSGHHDDPVSIVEQPGPGGVTFESCAVPLPDGGWVQTLSDVTARRALESALRSAKRDAERANRAKSAFLANLSHELRTPLNAIIGFSEILADGVLPDSERRSPEYANYIRQSGQLLLGLINEILDLSKIESGSLEIVRSLLNPADVLRQPITLMGEQAQRKAISIELRVAPETPAIYADDRSLRQILMNLISNAVKYTPDGGAVHVGAASSPDGGVEITVADTGVGMPESEIDRLFQPFQRLDNRVSGSGTGLGLAIVRALVNLHDGHIHIDSREGQGTRFTIIFPPSPQPTKVGVLAVK